MNVLSPFDGTHTNGFSDKVAETPNATLSTTNSKDILVGCETTNGGLYAESRLGIYSDSRTDAHWRSRAAEFQIVASTQTNLNIKFGVHDGSTSKWAMIVAGIA